MLEDTELFKQRRSPACIKHGSTWFITNLVKVIKKTWLPMLALSVLGGVLSYICFLFLQSAINDTPTTQADAIGNILQLLVPPFISILLCIGAFGWPFSRFFNSIHSFKMSRYFKAWGLLSLLLIVIFIVVLLAEYLIGISLMNRKMPVERLLTYLKYISLCVGVILLLHLPALFYSVTKYFYDDKEKVSKILTKGMLTGFRYWGFYFQLTFLSLIIVFALGIIVFLPATLLYIASNLDTFGMTVLGDPSGLPSYFTALACVTNGITTFILGYIGIWLFLVYYYAFGSIEAKRQALSQDKQRQLEVAVQP